MRSDVDNSLVVMSVTYGRACPYVTLILSTVDNVIVNVYDHRLLSVEKIRDNGNGRVFLKDRKLEKIPDAR